MAGTIRKMPRLGREQRDALPDRAFAYIDPQGVRRLPIHDASHVRNALVRFGQVRFHSERARDEARTRLLKAAKRFRIVPIGFITSQMRSEREQGAGDPVPVALPSGFVTMLMTDIEGSTGLVQQLGGRYRAVIEDVWTILGRSVAEEGGSVVEQRADEFFAAFDDPRSAVDAAVAAQRVLRAHPWLDGLPVRVRAGLHSGYPTSTADNYIGLDVNMTSRICAIGHGEQIVVSANLREAVKATRSHGVRFTSLGAHKLRGVAGPVELYQLGARGLPARFPPLRSS